MLMELREALAEPRWLRILAQSAYAPNPDALLERVGRYRLAPDVRAFGWEGRGVIVVTSGPRMVIRDIAVEPEARRAGVGRRMIEEAAEAVGAVEIVAETDDDAVGFYRRCGFTVEPLGDVYHSVLCRYRCVKRADLHRTDESAR